MGKQYHVKCYALDSYGQGLVKFNGSTFAIPRLLPDEKATIELVYTKGGTFAKLVQIDKPSPLRINPKCPHFSFCGGCQLMHLSYFEQLKLKQKIVTDLFWDNLKSQQKIQTDFPGITHPEVVLSGIVPVLGMKNPSFYRCKIHAALSEDTKHNIISGFYEEHTHKVLSVDSCLIQDPHAESIMKSIRRLMKKYHIRPFKEDTGHGTLRHVLFRKGYHTEELLTVLVCGTEKIPNEREFTKELLHLHPEITSLVLNYNPKKTSMVLGKQETVLFGTGSIQDKLCDYTFRISSRSFYQVNPGQAEQLYKIAISALNLSKTESVLDAYCGTGTLAILASGLVKRVVGVELNRDAVKDAVYNAKINHIKNASFFCADAGEYLTKLTTKKESFDAVLLDPPRSGCTTAFLNALTAASPKKIVYISCNPQTQKRDIDMLASDYFVDGIWAVDMFPETGHVETIILLSKK